MAFLEMMADVLEEEGYEALIVEESDYVYRFSIFILLESGALTLVWV